MCFLTGSAETALWSNHPTREDVMREYERIWALLGSAIEELSTCRLITDPDVLDTLDVFTEIVTPSISSTRHFFTRRLPAGDPQASSTATATPRVLHTSGLPCLPGHVSTTTRPVFASVNWAMTWWRNVV